MKTIHFFAFFSLAFFVNPSFSESNYDYSEEEIMEELFQNKKIACLEKAPDGPRGSTWQTCTCSCNGDKKTCWIQIPSGTNPNKKNCEVLKQECTDSNGKPGYLVNCRTP